MVHHATNKPNTTPKINLTKRTSAQKKTTKVNNTTRFQKTQWEDVIYYEAGVSSFHQPEAAIEYMT
jgi:hypothetical protein